MWFAGRKNVGLRALGHVGLGHVVYPHYYSRITKKWLSVGKID